MKWKFKKKTSLRLQALLLGLMILIGFAPLQLVFAADDPHDKTGHEDIVMTVQLQYYLKSQPGVPHTLEAPYTIDNINDVAKFRAVYTFEIKDHEGPNGYFRNITEDDYINIDLPDKVRILTSGGGAVAGKNDGDGNPRNIATFDFEQETSEYDWKIMLKFTDYLDDPDEDEIHGAMEFDFDVNAGGLNPGQKDTIRIPIGGGEDIEITINNPSPTVKNPTSINKTAPASNYDQQTRRLTWNVRVSPADATLTGWIFTDAINTDLLEFVGLEHDGALAQPGDYTYNPATGEIRYQIGEGRNSRDIKVITKVKSKVYEDYQEDGNFQKPTVIGNTAFLKSAGGTTTLQSTASFTVTPKWFAKKGDLYQGNKIRWTLTANETRQPIYDGVITEYLNPNLTLDTGSLVVNGTALTVHTIPPGHTTTDKTEIYATYDPSKTPAELKIYLPRDESNPSTAAYTATFVTDVKRPDVSAPGAPDPRYDNTADFTAKYPGDGPGTGIIGPVVVEVVGKEVPLVWVNKSNETLTAEDKSKGTISWIINAASNVADYGKSVVTDTLPLNSEGQQEQDIIAVYHLNAANQRVLLDEDSEPAAVISADKRTVTITFNSTPNALRTMQTFYVKTQIKEAFYGRNLDKKKFYNKAGAAIYNSEGTELDSAEHTHNVEITNPVISKNSSAYNDYKTDPDNGRNPRVNYTVVINGNKMPLKDVVVTDDLNNLQTEFREKGADDFQPVDSRVKWTYVPGSFNVTKTGTADAFTLANVKDRMSYAGGVITVDFRNLAADNTVNDTYTLTFTLELPLDVTKDEYKIFEKNGDIRVSGNVAKIEAVNLNNGSELSGEADDQDIGNDVLKKAGAQSAENRGDRQIVWTIYMNQHRIKLENPRVEDILPKGLTLDPTSVRLYKNVIGPNGKFKNTATLTAADLVPSGDYSWDYKSAEKPGVDDPDMEGRYVLTVELPDDQTDYILMFTTDVDTSLQDGTIISNSAYYAGETAGSQSGDVIDVEFKSSSSGGSTTRWSFTVHKTDAETNALIMDRPAEFSLYWLRNGTERVFVRTLATENGVITFRSLTVGEKYEVEEVKAPAGYRLDDPTPVPVTQDTPKPVVFANSLIKTGSWHPAAVKSLDVKSIGGHVFQFEIFQKDAGGAETVLFEGVTQSGHELSNSDGRRHGVAFTPKSGVTAADFLSFTDDHIFQSGEDEYPLPVRTFYMRETALDMEGYGFDDAVYELKVKAYNVKGRSALKIVIEDGDGNVLSDDAGKFKTADIPVFHNTYGADGSIELSAGKTLIGQPLRPGQFTFKLYEGEELKQTKTNEAGIPGEGKESIGTVFFDPIEYTFADVGTKIYRIVEEDTGFEYYEYDRTEYTVTVVIEDNDDGTLERTITYRKTLGELTEDADKIAFTNEYTASDTEAQITAKKILTGRTLAAGQFKYTLTLKDADAPIEEVTNAEGGGIAFAPLSYTQDDMGKTFLYEVRELNDAKAGYEYDNTVYTVAVEVVDNQDGTLGTNVVFTKPGDADEEETVEELVFSNVYTAKGSVQFTAKKELLRMKLENGQFAFVLADAAGNILQTVRNAADGSILFDAIFFNQDQLGEYQYKIYETPEDQKEIIFDKAVYLLTVIVTDNGDGTLDTAVTVQKESGGEAADAEQVLFVNEHTPASSVATGDAFSALRYSLLMLLSLALISMTLRRKKIKV